MSGFLAETMKKLLEELLKSFVVELMEKSGENRGEILFNQSLFVELTRLIKTLWSRSVSNCFKKLIISSHVGIGLPTQLRNEIEPF